MRLSQKDDFTVTHIFKCGNLAPPKHFYVTVLTVYLTFDTASAEVDVGKVIRPRKNAKMELHRQAAKR